MGNEYLIRMVITLGMWRGGTDLIDVSVVNDTQLQRIKNAINNSLTLWFGEIMGKHSEVDMNLANEKMVHFAVLSDNESEIELFKKWFPEAWVGNFSILEHLENRMEEMDDTELKEFGLI